MTQSLLLQKFVISSEVVFFYQNIKSVSEKNSLQVWNMFQKDISNKFARIQDPFRVKAICEFTSVEDENVVQLSCDNTRKEKFGSRTNWLSSVKRWIFTAQNSGNCNFISEVILVGVCVFSGSCNFF